MDQPGEFVSEPFDFSKGGILSIEAPVPPSAARGPVQYFLEGSEDRICWTELVSGVVTAGERVEVPWRGQGALWGRARLRSLGGNAWMRMRRFPGDRGPRA